MTESLANVSLTPIVTLPDHNRVIYALQPKQLEAYKKTPLALPPDAPYPQNQGYGGAAGGGKSYFSRAVAVAGCFLWPGCTAIIFRRTEDEVKQNHVIKFRGEVPEEIDGTRLYSWNGQDLVATFANGSRLYFGYLKTDSDVFRYQGPEFDIMIFEESTHYTWFQISWLTGNRLRASVEGTRPFALYPSNPGNLGHFWYKRLFIDKRYNEEEGESRDDYCFTQAKLADNQILSLRDRAYVKRLNKLPEPWRSWQRDGDFQAGAGAMISELSYDVHFIEPFKVPEHWPRYASFDWGYAHLWAFGEWAVSEDGISILLQTVTGVRDHPNKIAEKIRSRVTVEKLAAIYAGHDAWAKVSARGDQTPSISEALEDYGIYLTPANINRVQGLQALKRMLDFELAEDGSIAREPHMLFFDNESNRATVRTLENMVPDPENLEDVLKVNSDELGENGDDRYDMVRYYAASRSQSGADDLGPEHVSAWSAEALYVEAERRRHVDLVDETAPTINDPMFGDVW